MRGKALALALTTAALAARLGSAQPQDKAEEAPSSQESHPINVLTRMILEKPSLLVPSVAERFAGFIRSESEGKSSLGSLRQQLLPAGIRAQALEWVEKRLGDQREALSVAELYFVLGAGGEPPAWAQSHKVLSRSLKGYRAEDLAKAMRAWAAPGGRPGEALPETWPEAFLSKAAEEARLLLNEGRLKTEEEDFRQWKSRFVRDKTPGELKRFDFPRKVPTPAPKAGKESLP